MSIGNLKTEGNKGNNFPFQLKVLQGLQAIAASTSDSLDCCSDNGAILKDISSFLAGSVRTPHIISETGVGTTVKAFSVSFANIGTGGASIDGTTLPPGVTINFSGEFNNMVDSISYNATGTTLLITYLT